MARDRRKGAQPDGLAALLEAGDHRAARAMARARLAGGAADPEAGAVLASLAPEPGAVVAGVVGLLAAAAIAAWTVVAG
jgi:hypothetical protein